MENEKSTLFEFRFFKHHGQYVIAAFLVVQLICFVLKYINKRKLVRNRAQEESDFQKDSDNKEVLSVEPFPPKDVKHILFQYEKCSEKQLLDRSIEFYNNLNKRRSIRTFSSKPVPKEVIYNLIKAAGTSPSGAHTEPWTFVVVSNRAVKAQIRKIVESEEKLNYKMRMSAQWSTDLKPFKTNWVKEYLTEAPYLILVFRQEYGILPDGTKKNHYYRELSIAISCGILIAAIQYVGLVTLVSTPMNCGPALRTLLDRPLNEKLIILLPVGYPSKNALVPDIRRKDISKILVDVS